MYRLLNLKSVRFLLAFDQALGSSDGGAILLSAANRRFGNGLIEFLSASLPDAQQQGEVDHLLAELMRQRIYGLACGDEDANDAARIGADPMHKLLAGRDPLKALDLASQPALSRFEKQRHAAFALCDGHGAGRERNRAPRQASRRPSEALPDSPSAIWHAQCS